MKVTDGSRRVRTIDDRRHLAVGTRDQCRHGFPLGTRRVALQVGDRWVEVTVPDRTGTCSHKRGGS